MLSPHSSMRRKWLDLYRRRKPRCFLCGREPFTKVYGKFRCYFHRNP